MSHEPPKNGINHFDVWDPSFWETPMLKLYSYVQVVAAEQIVTL